MTAQEVVGDVFIALGVALIALAAIGLLRLPDVYNRANAVAKAAGLGMVLVLFGVVVLAPGVTPVITLLVAIALQLFTVPIASFKIGEAAYLTGAPIVPGTAGRELAGDPPETEPEE
ncbi:monovalent cation/H(+) antiporter subunit G [Blastococcus sp. CCUG 61487]|uniref:monovalent cation/H(+) antiporter subunit G n=1 Tax=Blastococcus sp. CCUG 61487 TaxID=1840703 RepID=UPI0010C0489B|nr:monovalent cation/H(+) antiporter subunit G [Blastococcus sp. CCUG 61487]TKJ18120.1 cation:proton antiporter [Blastococcus sp. CCUG 61487]